MKSKILFIAFSVLAAFGLWLYVISVVSPGSEETYYNIPIALQNENILDERDLMITSELPTVNLTLSGNRTDLNKLDSNNINVLVNMASIEAAGTHNLPYTVTYPGAVNGNDITRIGQSTNTIKLTVENRITKTLTLDNAKAEDPENYINIQWVGKVDDGCIEDRDNVKVEPGAINITGPESVVSKITQAKIQVNLDGHHAQFTENYVYELCDKDGNPVDAAMVSTNAEDLQVTVNVFRMKEIELNVKVNYAGGATEDNTTITQSHTKITVSGKPEALENLSVLELGSIDLDKLLEDETFTFPIELPEGVVNETGVAEVTVEVAFGDLKVRTLNVTNITALNVPEGMQVEWITEVVPVTVRGPSLLIDAISEKDVKIQVDFKDSQMGIAKLHADIVLVEKYKDAGIIDKNSYLVSAELSAIPIETDETAED